MISKTGEKNHSNRKWNCFSSDRKKVFLFSSRSSKFIFKAGYGIIQTGNGIISPHFQAFDQKTSFKVFLIFIRNSKLIFKIVNGIVLTGSGFISPTSRPLIKNLLLQNVSYLHQGVQHWFSKQEIELCKQEMELFLLLRGFWSNNFFLKMFYIFTKQFKIDSQNRQWNYQKSK